MKPALLPETVERLIRYEPTTGRFFWRESRGAVRVGDDAGTLVEGYRYIGIQGRRVAAHHIAWLLMTGGWCEGVIDHANRQKADNRWKNLRRATASQNKANTPIYRNNTSGFRGVHKRGDTGRWTARIRRDGRKVSLGTFDDPETASAAFTKAHGEVYGEFSSRD